MRNLIRGITAALLLAMLPLAANAALFVSVTLAPPALPIYVAPPMPAPGYFWTPGYWAYADAGYYWVPGTWVLAPAPGLLWTPGYWGWAGGVYVWHAGYWGPHVGFYGGINYGFGYGGHGFNGGAWQGGRFVANTTVINNTTIVNNTTVNRVSFNGGAGGVVARPTTAEARAAQERHVGPSAVQQQHQLAASRDMTMRASYNRGSPSVAATAKAGVFYGKGVVAAHAGGTVGHSPPAPQSMMHAQAGGQPGGGHGNAGAPGQSRGSYPRSPQTAQAHGAYPGSGHASAPQHGAPAGNGRPEGRGGEREERGGR
jgi:WXXGXW repeat (2 copies)